MAYMVSILFVVTLLGVVLHQPPAADALTCYTCSTSPSDCSCCGSEIGNAPTCEGSACATVFYPDGNVTRMCDGTVRHGCYPVGENEVCGCHENYCNTDICRVQDNCTVSTTASTLFPSSSSSSQGTTTRASTYATGTTSVIVPQNCGSSYYYGPSGVISSPNYPGNYSNYQLCNYYIDTSSSSSSIAVVFTAFDTEQCCDYVTISCPTIPLYPSLRYSGAFLPQPFSIPRCSQAIVNFTTDGLVISTGFSLDYYVNLGDCGATVYTESHDYISSPNYPNSHDNNLNCSNIIWARVRSSFTINFLDMDLEECCDFVELSCIDNAEYGSHRFTGSSIPPKQDIPGCTQVLVWFHSDDSLVKPGFNLEYFANQDPATDAVSQRKVSSNGMQNSKESRKGEERWSHH